MSSKSSTFSKASPQEVTGWYKWVMTLNNSQNPFDPADGGNSWKANNNEKSIIYLAGVTATANPAWKPSQIPKLEAQVAASQGTVVYNDGKGNPVQMIPKPDPRKISLKGDSRDLYCPVSTELAPEKKYPAQSDLLAVARETIAKEEKTKGEPPAFIELNGEKLQNGQLKDYSVEGIIDQLNVPKDNVFMLPDGPGKAGFSDYAVKVSRSSLKSGTNTLKFGVNGKFFQYEVEYQIDA